MRVLVFSLFNFLFSLFLSPSCTSLHFLYQNQSLKDGQTLVSDNRNFELGFFSPGTTKNRYVGIWYTNIQFQTVVWVANRENPLTDSSGILSVVGDGNLVILDGSGNTLWSSSISTTSKNSTAMLLDSNLILTEGASANSRERTLWQSFDHPTDTLMPKMMIGVYLETGKKRSLTSWKSEDDPAPGKFSLGLERQKVPQAFLYNESRRIWRSGQWNGQSFVGIPKMHSVYLNGFILETDRDERIMYLTHDFSSIIVRFLVDWSGMVKGLMLREDSKDSSLIWRQSISQCDVYGMCGSFGSCNHSKSPICACLIGFQPESAEEWGNGNWSVGCVRRTQLQCEKPGNYSSMMDGEGDGFLKMERVKLPDFADWLSLGDAKGCEAECLQNCSCVAYAYVSGIGCMIWVDGLIDIQEFSSGGEVLYIRLANSELENASLRKKKRLKPPLVVLVVAISILLGSSFPLAAFICYRRRQNLRLQAQRETSQEVLLFELGRNIAAANKFRDANNLRRNGTDDSDLKLFSFATISAATDNFSAANELGQGGFGPVYKGKLLGGQEIAVKRLSRSSGQGLEEFKNEIILIAKLQHMNLVRLFGCSIEGDEKILIYEYMPNKSLDSFLFDPIKKALLHWGKRVHIIEGIAQGLLYLHKYSRLKVIHRDLKTSNILLDGEMNPKISDFGMARIFGCNESEGNTNKVVGTYGYMSPEYAVKGLFSIKSDVFSFGVILLEILSGRKNNSFYHSDRYLNLLGYAWELWEGGRVSELVDPMLGDSSPTFELLRCIHVALLCVQEHAADRPTMSDVVSMLGNETIALPTPKQPAFSFGRNDTNANLRTSRQGTCSANDVTVSEVEGR